MCAVMRIVPALALVCLFSSCKCDGGKAVPPSPVSASCEMRGTWKNSILRKCSQCISLARAPACGCKTDRKEYSGVCAGYQGQKLAEDACEPVFQCAFKCKPTECDCLAACYEGKERCHDLDAALQSCLVVTCAPFCE